MAAIKHIARHGLVNIACGRDSTPASFNARDLTTGRRGEWARRLTRFQEPASNQFIDDLACAKSKTPPSRLVRIAKRPVHFPRYLRCHPSFPISFSQHGRRLDVLIAAQMMQESAILV